MATILSRFTEIMKANINDLLDRMEDPAKMIDQTMRELEENLAQVKKETAGVMAEEKRCRRVLDDAQAEVDKWNNLARQAVAAGKDDDARTFLSKKQQAQSKLADAQKVYQVAADNSAKMRNMHDKLVNDLNELNDKRANLKGMAAVAKTQETINKATRNSSKAAGTMEAFDRLEDRINRRLDAAMAEAELNEGPAADEATKLAESYENGEYSGNVDAELAALKAEMGIGNN